VITENITSIFETDEDEILKIINSKKLTIRLNFAHNPNVPSKYLYKMLDDDNNVVIRTILSHKNISGNMINKVISTNYRELNNSSYTALCFNSSLKKSWILKIIEFLKNKPEQSENILRFLENSSLFSNDAEWVELYDYIYERSTNFKSGVIFNFFFNFFNTPLKNYSERIVLMILDDYGVGISDIDPSFSCIINTPMDTPVVRAKLYKLTNNEDFLPQEALDIFLF